jgi:hypothetical protein
MTTLRVPSTLLFSTIRKAIVTLHWEEDLRGALTVPWFWNRIISFVAGIPFAFMCAAACWFLVDASVPLVDRV